jgi:hypothetical protein
MKGQQYVDNHARKQKSWSETGTATISSIWTRLPYQAPWVTRSGLGPQWKAQNSMPRPKQLEQKLHSITTSYFASCPVRPSAGNSPRRNYPDAPAVKREAEEEWRRERWR